jgi:hypothetical protein
VRGRGHHQDKVSSQRATPPSSGAQFVRETLARIDPILNPARDPDVHQWLKRWVRRRGLAVAVSGIVADGELDT